MINDHQLHLHGECLFFVANVNKNFESFVPSKLQLVKIGVCFKVMINYRIFLLKN